MSDDDEPQMMSHSMDADYENGHFVNGEFYYTNKRQRRVQSKEEAIYGVFGDYEDNHSRSQRGGIGVSSAPMAFVPTGTLADQKQSNPRPSFSLGAAHASGGLGGGGMPSFTSAGKSTPGAAPASSASSASSSSASSSSSRGGIGSASRAGLGSSRAGLGASDADSSQNSALPAGMQFSSFGKRARERERRKAEWKKQKKKQQMDKLDPLKHGAIADKNYAKFAKHTTGFGLKMLKKMGFKGRLGKHEQGLAAPIIPKLRPKGRGLQNYGERDESNMPRNLQEELEIAKKAQEAKKEEEKKQAAMPVSQNWRKSSKKPKRVYRTAAELTAQATPDEADQGATATPQVIIDMTGPQVKVTSADQITSRLPTADEWSPTGDAAHLPELKHNVRLLVELTEADIHKIDRDRRHAEVTVGTLQNQRKALARQVEQCSGRVANMEAVLAAIGKLRVSIGAPDDDDADLMGRSRRSSRGSSSKAPLADQLEQIVTVFEGLQRDYPTEYKSQSLASAALALGFPLLKKFIGSWLPLFPMSSARGRGTLEVIPVVARWKSILEGVVDVPLQRQRRVGMKRQRADMYQRMLEQLFLPKLQLCLSSEWNVRDHQSVHVLLKSVRDLLPDHVYQLVLSQLILPKLERAIKEWNPRTDRQAIHEWVLPWLEFYTEDELQPAFQLIRSKLAHVLRAWHPKDASALVVIKPWQGVFKPADYEALLVRSIVPKLVQVLHTEFQVNPHKQYLEPFQWVMKWQELLSTRLLVQVLRESFFPKWFHALFTWLSQDANFDEVSNWYSGWKGTLPPVLRDHAQVKEQFKRALDLINAALVGQPLQPVMTKIMAALRTDSKRAVPSFSVGVKGSGSANGGATKQSKKKKKRRAEVPVANDMSFRDIVEQFAELKNVEFLPNFKRGTHDGKQIYSFGKINVYLDNRCIFAHDKEKDVWQPIALDELVQRAEAAAV